MESRNEMSEIVLNLCEYVLNLCEYVQYSNYVENRVKICTHFFRICIYFEYVLYHEITRVAVNSIIEKWVQMCTRSLLTIRTC